MQEIYKILERAKPLDEHAHIRKGYKPMKESSSSLRFILDSRALQLLCQRRHKSALLRSETGLQLRN